MLSVVQDEQRTGFTLRVLRSRIRLLASSKMKPISSGETYIGSKSGGASHDVSVSLKQYCSVDALHSLPQGMKVSESEGLSQCDQITNTSILTIVEHTFEEKIVMYGWIQF